MSKELENKSKTSEERITSEKPVSLAPLDFEETLADLPQVKPMPKGDKPANEEQGADSE